MKNSKQTYPLLWAKMKRFLYEFQLSKAPFTQLQIAFDADQKIILTGANDIDFQESKSLMIFLLKGSKVKRLTVLILLRINRSSVDGRAFRATFDADQKVFLNGENNIDFQESGSLMIFLLKGSKVKRLTVLILLRINRSSVDGRAFRATFDADQKVISNSINGGPISEAGNLWLASHMWLFSRLYLALRLAYRS